MYCINCGVKLADSEKACPLCGTVPYHPQISRPEGEPLYPAGRKPKHQVRSRAAQIVATALFLLPQAEGQALLDSCSAEALWMDLDGNLHYSTNFKSLIRT